MPATYVKQGHVREYKIIKPIYEQFIRWKVGETIKLTELRAGQIGKKYVVPIGGDIKESAKRIIERGKQTIDKTKKAAKTVLDKLMPGLT